MMMPAQAPVSITTGQMGHGSHNLFFQHPMINAASQAQHLTAAALQQMQANTAQPSYNKAGKDTTWTKLFVGGLPYDTNDKQLREFFEEFGEIEEAVVIIDRQTEKSKGYGFVTMADTKAAARAVQNPNPVIQGRKSNVNYAFIGAKHNYHSNRGTAATSVAVSAGDEQSIYAALMSPEAYATAATATTMRYAAFLPPQYGAANTAAGAGAMMYTPASPYSAMMPTAMPIQAATAATQGQHMLAGEKTMDTASYANQWWRALYQPSRQAYENAYPTATAYDYGLAVNSSGAGATTTLPPQYFYPQVLDPSQYLAMASLQGTHLTGAAAPGSAGTMMSSMYQSIVPSSVAVSGSVTSVSAAMPAAAAPALSAASYPAIQEQR